MLNEAQRQFYLERMGVRLWYARSVQPGAAPSPDFDFGEPSSVTARVEVEIPTASAPGPADRDRKAGLANLRGLMERPQPDRKQQAEYQARGPGEPISEGPTFPVADQNKPVAAPDPEPDSADSVSEALTPGRHASYRPRVSVHWGIWISDRYALISAISPNARAQLQHALAHNILGAMGLKPQSPKMLQWPVFSNPAVRGNDESGLKALLQDLGRSLPPDGFIAMGLCQEEWCSDRSGWLAAALGTPVVDFEYSLAALATDPGRKRALWSRLRTLVGS